mmetsp:Transcript_8184/g.20066  ORF Transcript_8184/g.20066 Transcript_8184/m.20066 type:complete len:234 (+) Transcript_8184:1910-2611(+)
MSDRMCSATCSMAFVPPERTTIPSLCAWDAGDKRSFGSMSLLSVAARSGRSLVGDRSLRSVGARSEGAGDREVTDLSSSDSSPSSGLDRRETNPFFSLIRSSVRWVPGTGVVSAATTSRVSTQRRRWALALLSGSKVTRLAETVSEPLATAWTPSIRVAPTLVGERCRAPDPMRLFAEAENMLKARLIELSSIAERSLCALTRLRSVLSGIHSMVTAMFFSRRCETTHHLGWK